MISIASHASGVPIAAGRLADVPAAVAARLPKKGASVEGVGLIPVGIEDAPIRAGAATALYCRDGTRLGTLAVFSARLESSRRSRCAD